MNHLSFSYVSYLQRYLLINSVHCLLLFFNAVSTEHIARGMRPCQLLSDWLQGPWLYSNKAYTVLSCKVFKKKFLVRICLDTQKPRYTQSRERCSIFFRHLHTKKALIYKCLICTVSHEYQYCSQ